MPRSYPMPPRFPFPPMRLVMETAPGTCDLHQNTSFCAMLSSGRHFEPEGHIAEVLASFLVGCHERRCAMVDIGANAGWFTAYALSLGATVLAVEPQADLARAVRETAELNCWAERAMVLNAFVTDLKSPPNRTWPVTGGWRGGGFPTGLKLPAAPVVPIDDLLLGGASVAGYCAPSARDHGRSRARALLASASAEGRLLARIEELLTARLLRVRTIVIECHGCDARVLWRLQRHHRYTALLLNVHIDRVFLDARGVNVYGADAEAKPLPSFVEELHSVRMMRRVYRLAPNMSLGDWRRAAYVRRMYCNQYVLTTVPLLEPRYEHPDAIKRPSRERKAAGYTPPSDGLGTTAARV